MGPRNAVLGGGYTCDRCLWGLRWSSIWAHETLSWVGLTQGDPATAASPETKKRTTANAGAERRLSMASVMDLPRASQLKSSSSGASTLSAK
eukprot:5489761-Pyramimonas_sp.AAC.1